MESRPIADLAAKALFGKDRREVILSATCMTCDRTKVVFRDKLSHDEYLISGMCQACQDKVFNVPQS